MTDKPQSATNVNEKDKTHDDADAIPRDHVNDRDANLHVPEDAPTGTAAAAGVPLQPKDAPDADRVPLGEASAAPGYDNPVYSDTSTSKDSPRNDDALAQAEAETDAQRAAHGIDPEKAREQDTTDSRRDELEESEKKDDDR